MTSLLPRIIHSLSKTRAIWWLSKLGGLHRTQRYTLDYRSYPGRRSAKAERLVNYCLGEYGDQRAIPCSHDYTYFQKHGLIRLETDHGGQVLSAQFPHGKKDQKKVSAALISQQAKIPGNLHCWLVRGDHAGRRTQPEQGLHFSGMRSAQNRHLVLVPTSNRNRFLGPNLHRQMEDVKENWVPWNDKTDTAWWGGALTGDRWATGGSRTLTRREVLYHFRDHPSDQVCLHLTEIPEAEKPPEGLRLADRFTPRSAFRHKCVMLLPGNDIASGSSWYFAGNSVVLMPKPHLEHILYFEMNAWEHYVPLENDPADILVKLRWVLDNPGEAKQIIDNSHERLRWLCGPEYMWACNEVLRRVAGEERQP